MASPRWNCREGKPTHTRFHTTRTQTIRSDHDLQQTTRNWTAFPPFQKAAFAGVLMQITAVVDIPPALTQAAADDGEWARVTEDDRAIKIETDKLEAVIPKKNPKQWMTGIEKGSFLDKTTGFREVGDGLMVVDWLMEAGSDEAYGDQVFAPDGHGVGRYTWYANETDPATASLRPHGPRQQPSQAHGRGPAALPPDEARAAGGHPRQGLRRGQDDLPVRVRRPRPQSPDRGGRN